MDPDLVWPAIFAVGGVYELYAILKNKGTLSERVRIWFHTKTAPGKVVFAGLWVAFSVWFLIHILGG